MGQRTQAGPSAGRSQPGGPAADTKPASRQERILDRGRRVLELEAAAVTGLTKMIDDAFVRAVETVADCAGKVVVTGIGKAGIIGQKIAATLSSTGTPAIFLHPADAVHGDLGTVQGDDVILTLSNSGQSDELQRLLPLLGQFGCRIILITSKPDSPCAKLSDVVLPIGEITEACPLGLAPSSSTTAILAMGDAIALTVLEEKEFHQEGYALLHPAGSLGRRPMKVDQFMLRDDRCPRIAFTATVFDAIEAITKTPGRAGATSIVSHDGKLLGFFTDGDLRRLISSAEFEHPKEIPIAAVMTKDPKTTRGDELVTKACETLRRYKIDELPVVTEDGTLVGVLDIQDLLAAGFDDVDHGK